MKKINYVVMPLLFIIFIAYAMERIQVTGYEVSHMQLWNSFGWSSDDYYTFEPIFEEGDGEAQAHQYS